MSTTSVKQTWSVGIACYNEEATIARVVELLQNVLHKISKDNEIIIVDDNSTDNSQAIIKRLEQQCVNIKTIFHAKRLGIGATMKDIYFSAHFENVVFIPGDAQFDPRELLPFANVEDKTFVSFYRQDNEVYSKVRTVISHINKSMNKYLLGLNLKDVNWVNILKKRDIEDLGITSKSSIIASEVCAKLNILDCKPIEVVSTYYPRIAGKSRGASLRNTIAVSFELFKLVRSVRQFKKRHTRRTFPVDIASN